MASREELEKLDKNALVEMCLKHDSEINGKNLYCKWLQEEKSRLESIVSAVQLVLNNMKK